MDNKHLEQFIRIYNTLLLINTKGEDTVLMGDILKAFKSELDELTKDDQAEADNGTVVPAQ